MLKINLLPCPFCGRRASLSSDLTKAHCSDRCQGGLLWLPIEIWNTRHFDADVAIYEQYRESLRAERERFKELEIAVRKAFRRYDEKVSPSARSAIFDLIKTKRRKKK